MTQQFEHHVNEILNQGYTIIPDVLDAPQLRALRDALDGIFQAEAEIAKVKNWHNSTYKVSYCLPQKHQIFRDLALNPRLVPIMRSVLGDNCNLSNINGLTMTSGGQTQGLHLDAPESTPGNCIYINALHCLDDFTRENGATRVVPDSHKTIWKRGSIGPEVEQQAIYLTAKAGSVIAYNGALLHAGSQNNTQFPRRALHMFYHRAWAKPQWDYPKSFSPDVIGQLSEEQKTLFGFYSMTQVYNPITHEVTKVH